MWIRLSPNGWPGVTTSDGLDDVITEFKSIFNNDAELPAVHDEVVESTTRPTKVIDDSFKQPAQEKLDNNSVSNEEYCDDAHLNIDDQDGIKLEIGKKVDQLEEKNIYHHLSNTELNQLNIGIVGDLGTGKTSLLKSLLYQLSSSADKNRNIKPRILIFDYKSDYSTDEKDDFIHRADVKIIKPHNIPINLFNITNSTSENPKYDRYLFFWDILEKIYKNKRPIQKEYMKLAIMQSYDEAALFEREEPTIYDIFEEYKNVVNQKIDTNYSILSDMVSQKLFEKDHSKIISMDEFLDGVVVINLDSLGQDDNSKNMIVAIFLNLFYEHMLAIEKKAYQGTDPQLRVIESFLLVDEANSIMKYNFDVLNKILLQGREFGVGVILASQFLSHFKQKNHNYKESLLTWFIHKVPNITLKDLNEIGLISPNGELIDQIKSFSNHECLYKTYNNNAGGEIINAMPYYKLYL